MIADRMLAGMHASIARFSEEAQRRYGFEPDVHEFSEGTKTAVDAAEAIGCDVAQIASSIAVSTDDGLAVVVTSGAHRVDMDAVAGLLDVAKASMADPDEVKETLGWSIGGVPPFCHEADVPVLIDETLFEHDEVWAAAGTPDAVFPIHADQIEAFSGGRPARVHQSTE